jgi:hypothetical protein
MLRAHKSFSENLTCRLSCVKVNCDKIMLFMRHIFSFFISIIKISIFREPLETQIDCRDVYADFFAKTFSQLNYMFWVK